MWRILRLPGAACQIPRRTAGSGNLPRAMSFAGPLQSRLTRSRHRSPQLVEDRSLPRKPQQVGDSGHLDAVSADFASALISFARDLTLVRGVWYNRGAGRRSQVARQGSAKPPPWVRIPPSPSREHPVQCRVLLCYRSTRICRLARAAGLMRQDYLTGSRLTAFTTPPDLTGFQHLV